MAAFAPEVLDIRRQKASQQAVHGDLDDAVRQATLGHPDGHLEVPFPFHQRMLGDLGEQGTGHGGRKHGGTLGHGPDGAEDLGHAGVLEDEAVGADDDAAGPAPHRLAGIIGEPRAIDPIEGLESGRGVPGPRVLHQLVVGIAPGRGLHACGAAVPFIEELGTDELLVTVAAVEPFARNTAAIPARDLLVTQLTVLCGIAVFASTQGDAWLGAQDLLEVGDAGILDHVAAALGAVGDVGLVGDVDLVQIFVGKIRAV